MDMHATIGKLCVGACTTMCCAHRCRRVIDCSACAGATTIHQTTEMLKALTAWHSAHSLPPAPLHNHTSTWAMQYTSVAALPKLSQTETSLASCVSLLQRHPVTNRFSTHQPPQLTSSMGSLVLYKMLTACSMLLMKVCGAVQRGVSMTYITTVGMLLANRSTRQQQQQQRRPRHSKVVHNVSLAVYAAHLKSCLCVLAVQDLLRRC